MSSWSVVVVSAVAGTLLSTVTGQPAEMAYAAATVGVVVELMDPSTATNPPAARARP
jgi:hypothetical protein